MSTLTAPLTTSLVDQVKAALAHAGYDAAVRHRKTHALMRNGFLAVPHPDGSVVVTHKAFPHALGLQDYQHRVSLYLLTLSGNGWTLDRRVNANGMPYLIIKRLV